MGISDHLICPLWNLYAGQKATVRTRHGKTGWFQFGKGVWQCCILFIYKYTLFIYLICRVHHVKYGLAEAQAGIKIAVRNINNLRYANDTTLMAESEEELKSLSMKVKEESEKSWLKLNSQNMKIMASGPITLWQIDAEILETVRDFFFPLGSKITVKCDCSHEIKRCLLLGKKSNDKSRQCIKNFADITLLIKVCLGKAMVSPVVMYACESWTVKKAEHQRTDTFKLWCWRRPEISLEQQGDQASQS